MSNSQAPSVNHTPSNVVRSLSMGQQIQSSTETQTAKTDLDVEFVLLNSGEMEQENKELHFQTDGETGSPANTVFALTADAAEEPGEVCELSCL